MPNEMFTRNEVANIFKVKPKTLWRWEKKGLLIPTRYEGNKPRYSIEALEQAVEVYRKNTNKTVNP